MAGEGGKGVEREGDCFSGRGFWGSQIGVEAKWDPPDWATCDVG